MSDRRFCLKCDSLVRKQTQGDVAMAHPTTNESILTGNQIPHSAKVILALELLQVALEHCPTPGSIHIPLSALRGRTP